MTKTQYLPAEWLDETVPPPVDHPDDLIRVIDGKFYLMVTDDPEDDEADVWWQTEIVNGEFVDFCEFRDHGHWIITVARDADGDLVWRGDGIIPDEANCFYANGDTDTFAESIGAMLRGMAESDPDLSGDIRVHAYHWSDGKPWYFAIDDDGCGHFSPPGTFDAEAVH